MTAAKPTGADPAATPVHGECRFPSCEGHAVTTAGMCQHHRRVVVSSTGSWLEAS